MRLSGTRFRSLGRCLSQLQSLVGPQVCPAPRTCTALFGLQNSAGLKESSRGLDDEGLKASHRRRQSVLGFQCERSQGFFSSGDGDDDKENSLSKHYEENRFIWYSPEQLFAVAAAVDLYQDFVPWCQRSTVLWRKNDEALEAELEIGFNFLVERYISHVTMKRPIFIKTSVSESTLFEHLDNLWEFKPGPTPDSCHLHFLVDFQFRSPIYRKVANLFFNEVVSKLVSSFEERCRKVYGPSVGRMKPLT